MWLAPRPGPSTQTCPARRGNPGGGGASRDVQIFRREKIYTKTCINKYESCIKFSYGFCVSVTQHIPYLCVIVSGG